MNGGFLGKERKMARRGKEDVEKRNGTQIGRE
jgi:hypothetical protein